MNITGVIHEIKDSEQVSEKLKKRDFILKDDLNEQYPQYIKFELNNDRCSLVDSYKIGDRVNVHFNLRGRIAQSGQCFNQLQCWKID